LYKILKIKEVPYLFALLMGLLIYLVNDAMTSYRESPSLLYSFEVEKETVLADTISEQVVCHLINASSHNLIEHLEVTMQYATDVQQPDRGILCMVEEPSIVPVAPAGLTDHYEAINVGGLANMYTLGNIQPNSRYELHARIEHHSSITEMPKLYITSEHPVRLVGGCEAWAVRYMPAFQWCLIGILIIGLPLYFVLLTRYK